MPDVHTTPPKAYSEVIDQKDQVDYSKETIRPLGNWCLIKKIKPKLISDGKHGNQIHLAEVSDNPKTNEHTLGRVLAVGPGQEVTYPAVGSFPAKTDRTLPWFRKGDAVIFNPYCAKVVNTKVDLGLVLVPCSEVLCVLECEEQLTVGSLSGDIGIGNRIRTMPDEDVRALLQPSTA